MKKILCFGAFVLSFLLLASFAAAQDLDSLFLQGKGPGEQGAVVEDGPDSVLPGAAEPAGRIGLAQWKNGVVLGNQSGMAVVLPGGVVAPGQLYSKLGSDGGGRFDAVVTPDNRTAIVSNFGDSTVYFVDISNPYKLTVKGFLPLPFFAEDIALSRDGKWALVTDGGFSPAIAVIDVANMLLHDVCDTGTHYCNAVDISPDSRTVICANYFDCKLEVFTFDPTYGTLKYKQSVSTFSKGYRPVNVTISPGGTTVVGVGPAEEGVTDPDFHGTAGSVFQLSGGALLAQRPISGGMSYEGSQTAVFSNDGQFVYILGNTRNTTNLAFAKGAVLKFPVTNRGVLGPKTAMNSIATSEGTSALFGVEAMAIDNVGSYLYVTNKTISGGNKYMAILNPNTLQLVKYVAPFDSWIDPFDPSDPDPLDIPAGIAFPTYTGVAKY